MSDWRGRLGSLCGKAVHILVEPEPRIPGPRPLLVRPELSRPPADVIIDPDAQRRLAQFWDASHRVEVSQVFPVLAGAGDNGEQIDVYIGPLRLGTLSAADSADFRDVMAKAMSQDRQVIGLAIRDREASGSWALRVYRPENQTRAGTASPRGQV